MWLAHGSLMSAGYMELTGGDRYVSAPWLPDVFRVHGVSWCW